MIEEKKLSPKEIREVGWDALLQTLGPSGALKFMLDYDKGYGNYCEYRKEIFKDKSVHELVDEMKKDGYV